MLKIKINYKNIYSHPYFKFLLIYIGIGFFIFIPTYLYFDNITSLYSFSYYYKHFTNLWDTQNYLKIAEYGYAATGDNAPLIVFFPFYPICIKVLHLITRFDYALCATIISNACSYFSMIMLYKLASLDLGEKKAWKVVKFYLLFPFTFFIYTGLSEGLFMLLLFSCIYLLRKKRYIFAGIVGFLLALTRLPGLTVGVIMLAETIIMLVKEIKKHKFTLKKYLKPLLMMAMTLCGFIVYLLINYSIHGDAFAFLSFQKNVWFQEFKGPLYFFTDLLPTQTSHHYDPLFRIATGYTNLISYILVLLTALIAFIKLRPSYGLYTLTYLIVCYSSSWLLSGARYSIGAFSIFMLIGIYTKKHKVLDIILTVLFLPAILYFAHAFYFGKMC